MSLQASFTLRGSGGMAKAVTCALRDAGFVDGLIVARNEKTGQALAGQYGFRWKREPAEDECELLVNVTPLGMAGGDQANELDAQVGQHGQERVSGEHES